MAQNHPLSTPFAATGDGDGLESALTQRVALVYDDAADVQALDLSGVDTLAIILGRDVFAYVPSDTTTSHDGVTWLVTADGKRFSNDGSRIGGAGLYAADDRGLTSPPGSPSAGSSYLLPAAPTGAWASYGNHLAVYRDGNWQYIAPRQGMLVYVADETAFVHYSGSAWVDGLGSLSIGAGTVTAAMMQQAYGWWAESETATPPGSVPSAGVRYIVGASATGDWSGEDGNIAVSDGSAWSFDTAVEGMTVFNKDLGYNVSYKSGSWQAGQASGLLLHRGSKVTNGSNVSAAFATYVTLLSMGSRAVSASGNRIFVRGNILTIENAGGTDRTITIGLFADSESSPKESVVFNIPGTPGEASAGFEFEFTVPDTASRSYFIKINSPQTGTMTVPANRASAFLEEVSA